MTEVASSLILSCQEIVEHRKLDVAAFWAFIHARNPGDEYLSLESLKSRKRIPWASYIGFLDAMDEFLGGEGAWELEYFGLSLVTRSTWIPHLQAIMRLLASSKQAYWVTNNLVGKEAFGDCVQMDLSEMPDQRLRLVMTLAPGLTPSETFFRVCKFGVMCVPSFIGLPNAVVDAQLGPRIGVYLVAPPPSRTIFSFLVRRLRNFFMPAKVLTEVLIQESELRANNFRLQESETELKRAREALESRVKDRTVELEIANLQLRERLEELILKEAEKRVLDQRVVHLQKLEAIGTLSSGITHEINNVLYGIFLSLDLAERKLKEGDPAREDFDMAKKFASRGRDLMKQMLTFSRKMQTDRRVVDLRSLLLETERMMRPGLAKSVVFAQPELPLGLDPVPAWAEPTLLQQVLVNLCSNAAQAMEGRDGVLRTKLEVMNQGGKNFAVISVIDEGCGIDPEIRGRIFEPFFTTKPVGRGTGMGLAVVFGILQSHGGEIEVESEIGKGSTFRVMLPLMVSAAAKSASVSLALGGQNVDESGFEQGVDDILPEGGNERLLLVEDEGELLNLMKDTLEAFGYRVTATDDPSHGLRLLATQPHAFDIIVTDFSMPGMTGLEFAHQARMIRPHLPIVLCTAFTEIRALEEATGAVINSVVPKPFDGIILNESIRAALTENEHKQGK